MTHSLRKALLLLFVALVINSAAVLSAFPLPREGGTATCLLMDKMPGADPMRAASPGGLDIARACYITLFQLGPDAMPQPYLCREYKLNWFDRDLRITLRDAGFSNGSKITSTDCKFTIERVLSGRPDLVRGFESVAGMTEFIDGTEGGVRGIIAEDDETLVIHLDAPDAVLELLEALSNPALGIISSVRYSSTGVNYFSSPVTSGPFKYSTSGDSVILSPQENFPFGKPWLDSIILKYEEGEKTHLDFSVGSVDLIETPPAYYYQYRDDDVLSHRRVEAGVMVEYTLLLDPDVPPLNEPDVRRAIRLAIDYEGIVYVTLGGAALDSHLMPDEVRGRDYTELMTQAVMLVQDYADLQLYPFEIGYPSGDGRAELLVEKISINLQQLGLNATLKEVQGFGQPRVTDVKGIFLMPYPVSTVLKPGAEDVTVLAREYGFGGDTLASLAARGGTAEDCVLPLLRPQRLVVTSDEFIPPGLGLWGEIDFFRLSLE